MLQIKIGHFEADGGAIHLPIGFQPDYVRLIAKGASSTNAIVYEWFREMEDHDSIDGWSFTDGVDAEIASGSGITAYDTSTEIPTISEWSASTSVTARSSTAHGSYVKATTSGTDVDGNEIDRSAIFECVVAGTTGSSEPNWPTEIGANGPSDNSVIWQKVNVATERGGYKGFSLAASMTGLADGNEGYYLAIGTGNVVDHGDVAGWTGGIKGA
jgi:hypothetical protein